MPISDWMPGLEQVGALIRARTRNTLGVEVGTFTADTRPTDEEAHRVLVQACQDIVSEVGHNLPAPVWNIADSVGALGTALLIELSYYPEQINSGASPYIQLKELYDQRLANLKRQVRLHGGDEDPSAPPAPVSSYPQPARAPYVGLVTPL